MSHAGNVIAACAWVHFKRSDCVLRSNSGEKRVRCLFCVLAIWPLICVYCAVRLENITGRDVLREIERQKGRIGATKGFVAGGSVSTAIWNLAHGASVPVRDIDIFLAERDYALPPAATAQADDYQIPAKFQTPARVLPLTVTQSGVCGHENHIAVRRQDGTKVTEADILGNFDLNCVTAGVNLETKQLVMHPSFVWFMGSGKLRVLNIAAPAETLLRGVDKASTMGFPALPEFHSSVAVLWDASVGGRALLRDTMKRYDATGDAALCDRVMDPCGLPVFARLSARNEERLAANRDKITPYFDMLRASDGRVSFCPHPSLPAATELIAEGGRQNARSVAAWNRILAAAAAPVESQAVHEIDF